MSGEWIFWAMLIAAIVHVLEEYFGGFIEQMRKFITGVTFKQFAILNALFILLCLLGALVPPPYIIFSMSVAALLVINALIHAGAAIRIKGYSAGLITAMMLYLPLSAYAYYHFMTGGELTVLDAVLSFVLGALYMLLVPIFQGIRLAREGKLNRKNIRL